MASRKILVVEDESLVGLHIANSLTKMGYTVPAVVASGEEAVKKAEEFRPDLVLMDIVLKGEMDGIEAYRQIRSSFDIPVIYLTAYSDDAILQRAKITEPLGYLLKPFNERELRTAIEVALYKHEMETRLRRMERWLTVTLRSIGEGVIATDMELRITFMNKIAEDLTGWTQEDAIGKKLTEIFNIKNSAKEDTKTIERLLQEKVLRDGVIINLMEDSILLTKDSKEVPVSDSMAPIREDYDHIPGVVIVFRDITEQKKSEELIKNILESVGEGLIVLDPGYKIIAANRAYGELVKRPAAEVIGKHCYEVSHLTDRPCHESGVDCAVRRTFLTGQPHTAVHVHCDSEGNSIHVETKSYPMKNSSGTVTSVIEIINDITERRKLEDQLRQSQKMEAIGNLAGGIAHDFNNLLSAIIGYSELILTELPDGHSARKRIEIIKDAGEKAATLTGQLLAFSRKQILEIKVIDLNAIVENMTKILARVIGENIQLEINTRPSVKHVRADPGQIEQVLMNLAVNARDAMPNGGCLTIETENVDLDEAYAMSHAEVTPGAYVMLAVTDTGSGMGREVQEKIFEPFFTTKGDKGTGLGLSTVYGIIKQHGGNIYVYSEPGVGSTFNIYLPSSGEIREKSVTGDQKLVLQGTETILVVDDEPSIRRLILDILQPLGYRLLEASSGAKAIRISEETAEEIDILLTDVVMPEMGGMELARTIRKSRPAIKVIFTSGYIDNTIVDRGMLDERTTFLQKPITPRKLVSHLAEVLQKKT